MPSSQSAKIGAAKRALLFPVALAKFGSAGLLLLIMLIGCADVVGTVVFSAPVPAAMELASTLFGVAIFLAWPGAQYHRGHIRVELFTAGMPRRMRFVSDGLSLIAGLVFFSLIVYGLVHHAAESWAIKEKAVAIFAFPVYPAKIAASVGAVLTVAVLIWQITTLLMPRTEEK